MTAPRAKTHVAPGMPKLDTSGQQTSLFEFWPMWLMYLPVIFQSLLLAIRYRSLTLPLIANPKLPLSGMVGVKKSTLLSTASAPCNDVILNWIVHQRDPSMAIEQETAVLLNKAKQSGLSLPLVCKPDVGCRGSGVKLIKNDQQLQETIAQYPAEASIMLQQLAQWEPEVGVFYVRKPKEPKGKIVSLALKYCPYVVGDGKRTLKQLIESDDRARQVSELYFERHAHRLNDVIADGEPYRLVFSASHCRGAIFRDANELITPELTQRIDELMQALPEFFYGRLDVKFKDVCSLKQGKDIEIIEINSASSEQLHIWDRNTSLGKAVSSLLYQYRTLFAIGAQNRQRGYQPPKLTSLLKAWRHERQLTQFYPDTD